MEEIQFDSGVREYRLGKGGILRFNPTDPNIYARFGEAADAIRQVEEDLQSHSGEETDLLRLMAEADRRAKEILSQVFGGENDFDRILGGVNLLAVGENGERVITNLFAALLPIMQEGAELCIRGRVEQAVAEAAAERQDRGSGR